MAKLFSGLVFFMLLFLWLMAGYGGHEDRAAIYLVGLAIVAVINSRRG